MGADILRTRVIKITITSNLENHARAFESLGLGRADYMLEYEGPAEIALGPRTIDNLQNILVKEIEVFFVITKETKNAENILRRLEQAYIDIYGLPQID
jgi:polar amino acid transport system substrate-binding protein